MGFLNKRENKPTIRVIENKLATLESQDKAREIFGAGTHQYRKNPVLATGEIQAFEAERSIRLPEGYSQYLQTIANGGVGPFYGLYALGESERIIPDLSKPFPFTRSKPLDMMAESDRIPAHIPEEEHEAFLERICETADQGILFLCTEGCGIYSVLVVKGQEAGTVWYYDLASDTGVFPMIHPATGQPMQFLEWYEIWLDRAILSLTKSQGKFISYAAYI